MVKPNMSELTIAIRRPLPDDAAIVEAAIELGKKFDISNILVTKGASGMILWDGIKAEHIRSVAKEVFDVSGAGDTAIAVMAAMMASGRSVSESSKIANKAAGIVVGKLGTRPINQGELFDVADQAATD